MNASENYQQWLLCCKNDEELYSELLSLDRENAVLMQELFATNLKFGTGGLRGVMGVGSGQMNIHVVGRATKALANHMHKSGLAKKVAIGYDTRRNSQKFADHAAKVLAANGIAAHIYHSPVPTPALSFAVRALGCGAGICITASHNPAKYNGYKVYGADGGQITTQQAGEIQNEILGLPLFASDEKEHDENIFVIEEKILQDYLHAVMEQRVGAGGELSVVYTPLHGAGLHCVTRILQMGGYTNVHVVLQQTETDGKFSTCKSPNPEEESALALALELAKSENANLVLATDPDCDRLGVAVLHKGEYKRLTGNQLGVLLLDYLCKMRKKNNSMPQNALAVKTIVTTEMARPVAAHYGVELIDVLTGFKFIGEQIALLEAKGEEKRFLFGFEESCGYLAGSYVRDKDAVLACVLTCDMAASYRANGKTLWDALEDLQEQHGYHESKLSSFEFLGSAGDKQMHALMERLRCNTPKELQDATKIDYLNKTPQNLVEASLPPSNVLQFKFADGAIVTVRPSGTEPKLKIYASAVAGSQSEAERRSVQLCELAKRICEEKP